MELYKNIGNLFYAIAASDNSIVLEELEALHKNLNIEWSHNHTEEEIDAIMDSFLHQKNSNTLANDSFSEFSKYLDNHKELFHSELKQLIFKTSKSIAYSYASKNKSELVMLAKLSLLFKV